MQMSNICQMEFQRKLFIKMCHETLHAMVKLFMKSIGNNTNVMIDVHTHLHLYGDSSVL